MRRTVRVSLLAACAALSATLLLAVFNSLGRPQFAEVTSSKPMYTVSDAITVNVPEPATLALLAIAILLGLGHQALRMQRKPALARVVKTPPGERR